ncbi:YncE family protein [Sandaracinus amylolyticus]|uniref:PKD domain containing protein n=1 Tax=Sandaracinus amylolyticus TaxID=927083 RepID=A0A0F6SG29_9BACT|nr:hypothetical protein [Sandaracinus amylolyticus]AKF07974.1 PKD domain containing protein [Sandaracinus amylolyticus]
MLSYCARISTPVVVSVALAACDGRAAPSDGGSELPDAVAQDDAPDAPADAGPPDVLFVGNSYVFVNDVAGHYRAIVPGGRVEEVTEGGYTFAQHAADARTEGTALARALDEDGAFDVVVLQEQSQIGGFYPVDADRIASIAGASELGALARARGARVVLYATWGRERGDTSGFPPYTTYRSMQAMLDAGYLGLAALLRDEGVDVRIAPVGGAFHAVHDDVVRAGGDPYAEGSDFDALYEPDESHPSLRGAYLAACVIAATITGDDPRTFVDEPTLGADTSSALRDACARAIDDPRWTVPAIVRTEPLMLDEPTTYGRVGITIAMSSDGSRVIAGASAMGSARVFARGATAWAEEIAWADARDVIALSGDGVRAIAGDRIVRRENEVWTDEATVPPGPGTFVGRGGSAALSADGTRAVVGGLWDETGEGATVSARVLVRSGETWAEEAPIPASEASLFTAVTVAMDATGERIVVSDGAVRVFVRDGTTWNLEGTLGTGRLPVAISGDGTRALVGDSDALRAIAYLRSGTTWAEEQTLIGSPASRFGSAVALSADGTRAIVGAPGDMPVVMRAGTGSARVFVHRDGAFHEDFVVVPREPATVTPNLGWSVALDATGTRAALGEPDHDAGAELPSTGRAHVAELP